MRQILTFSLLSFLIAAPAAVAGKPVKVPALDKQPSSMTIEFVRYTGGTNGEMVVEIANRGKRAETFDASGLYFVPEGDPEKAPQRLGAAGPFKIKSGQGWSSQETVALKPGEKKTLHLQVFCIDSHRSSPQASHKFSIAATRMPKELRQTIKAGTADILHKNKGEVAKAKPAIQSHVWKSRDSKWIKLEGERAAEKSVDKHPRQIHRQQRTAD